MMEGKYLYGIIDSSKETDWGISGLGGLGPAYTVAHQDVGCVVSDYVGADFGSLPKEEVIRHLLKHQAVVEHVMEKHTVLPVKFGTVLGGGGEAISLLRQGHRQLVAALGWIQDKVEIEVAATWDTKQVLREISAEPEIAQAREALAGRLGGPTLDERLHLGQTVKAALDRRRDSYRVRMIESLRPAVVDLQLHALVSDELVMNVAFLVERSGQEEFDRRVRQLNDLFHDQIQFRILGPLPPYSFATVEITRWSPEKIEEARQLLQLGEDISETQVRKAYRHLAAETHPDRRPGDEMAKVRFLKLRQASDLLMSYCRGGRESEGGLSLAIRRTGSEEVQHSLAEVMA